MNIRDLLLRYRLPLFEAEGAGGGGAPAAGADGGAPAPAAPAAATALGGDAPAGDAETPDDGDKPAGDADAKDGDKPDDAPAEFKLAAPEGMENFQGEFDTFSSEANEWMTANPKATPADALKWAADRQAAAVGKQTADMSEAFSKQIQTWETEARSDKETGGDAFDANLAKAKVAIDTYGDDSLKAILNESGLGSHPAVIKFAIKAGAALSDAPIHKTSRASGKKNLADTLYPKKD